MQSWIADLKYAWRKLFGGSGVGGTLVAIFSIGLGVGVSAAIFGAVDRILLVAPPYPEPQRVTVIEQRTRDGLPRPWRTVPLSSSSSAIARSRRWLSRGVGSPCSSRTASRRASAAI